jgi:hypothetical protein
MYHARTAASLVMERAAWLPWLNRPPGVWRLAIEGLGVRDRGDIRADLEHAMSSVSVVIPCYKYGHYLEEAATSALDDQEGVDVRVAAPPVMEVPGVLRGRLDASAV